MNGAVEKAVRPWEGQLRTVRDYLEGEIAAVDERQIDAKHPFLQWCAWGGQMGVRRTSSSLATKPSTFL